MSLKQKIIDKIKKELSIQDFNNILINPLYDNIIEKISPYCITIFVLLSLIIILLIIVIITNIILLKKN
jgi:hypothetical protein